MAAVRGGAEKGAGTRVRHHDRCAVEDELLGDESLDSNVARNVAECIECEMHSDRCHHVDVQGPEGRCRDVPREHSACRRLGAGGDVHQRPAAAEIVEPGRRSTGIAGNGDRAHRSYLAGTGRLPERRWEWMQVDVAVDLIHRRHRKAFGSPERLEAVEQHLLGPVGECAAERNCHMWNAAGDRHRA